jgi:large subunit ribosomal protein L18e
MPKPTGPTNMVLKNLIADIKSTGYKEKSDFLLNLARLLETPERRRATVNLSKIERESDGKETIFVPGKVLSSGELTKPIKIASFSISAEAAKKIKAAGGKHIDVPEMLKEHPKGKGVRIIL